MVEFIILFMTLACVAWVAWTVRRTKQALKDAGLDEALR